MKHIMPLLLTGWLAATAAVTVNAQDDHSSHHPAKGGTQDESVAPASEDSRTRAKSRLDVGLSTLSDVMSHIESTDDPSDRDCLLGEHLLLMLDQIEIMRHPSGAKKSGPAKEPPSRISDCMKKSEKQAPAATSEGKDMGMQMKHGAMMDMHKQVQERLDRIELMIEQLLRHMRARETLAP